MLMCNRPAHRAARGRRLRPRHDVPVPELTAGEVGYVATGLKSVRDCQVGDTITLRRRPCAAAAARLPPGQADGLRRPLPRRGRRTTACCATALEKLQLNDASLIYEPETSQALGFGFRCGFLGLFHMEIVQERLEREYDLDLIVTAPSVEYEVLLRDGTTRYRSTARPSCRPRAIAGSARALGEGHHRHADRVHRHGDGAGATQRAARRRTWSTSTNAACCSPTRCRWPR